MSSNTDVKDLYSIEKNQYNNLGFEPTKREIDLFNKEKMDMYKGTFVVCLVYGLIAIGLLMVVFMTDWGRDYVYNKMMPAVATFVFGAIFIILYLAMSIYDLKPRQLRTRNDKDNEVICPDYWKLSTVSDSTKQVLLANNQMSKAEGTNAVLFDDIKTTSDNSLKFKCEMDPDIYELNKMSEYTNKVYNRAIYNDGYRKDNVSKSRPDYVYVKKTNPDTPNQGNYNDDVLAKYAQFAGAYNQNSALGTLDNSAVVPQDQLDANASFLKNNKPLICNMVYPQVLATLDAKTPEKNKYRCAYAKACDITWSDLGCKYEELPASTT